MMNKKSMIASIEPNPKYSFLPIVISKASANCSHPTRVFRPVAEGGNPE
jgi:hypothetical protein